MTIADEFPIAVLVRRRLALVEQRDSIAEQIRAIDAQITDAIEVGGVAAIDDQPIYRVAQRRTFSMDLAEKVVPPEIIEAATVPKVDEKTLKSLLPPALVDACMKPGAIYLTPVKGVS